MKAYIISSENTDIYFLWNDDEFLQKLKFINADAEGCNQLSQVPVTVVGYLQMFLSPIIVSYQLLRGKFDERCTTISSSSVGCDVVFQAHDDLLYMGFCKTASFSVEEMQKSLSVLHDLTKFLFGPCKQSIKPTNQLEKIRNWNKISHALLSYCRLYNDEQCFLLGCIDKLHVNSDMQTFCSIIVENCMKTLAINLSGESLETLGIVFVGNKVLTRRSRPGLKPASELSTADLLKILILVNSEYEEEKFDQIYASSAADAYDLFQDSVRVERNVQQDGKCDEDTDSSARIIPPVPRSDSSSSNDSADGNDSSLERELFNDSARVDSLKMRVRSHSWPQRRSSSGRSELSITSKDDADLSKSTILNGHLEYAIREAPNSEQVTNEEELHRGTRAKFIGITPDPRSLMRHYSTGSPMSSPELHRRVIEVSGNEYFKLKPTIRSCPVFLDTHECPHRPYMMHSIHLAKQVHFVILSEMKFGGIAVTICNFLLLLKKVKLRSVSLPDHQQEIKIVGGQKTLDRLNNCCSDLKSKLRRHAGMHQQLGKIFDLWTKHISKQMQAHMRLTERRSGNRLDQNITELRKQLQSLFHRLFIDISRPGKPKVERMTQLKWIGNEMRNQLKDYFKYLIVKSYRNIDMNWEHKKYPGMLHYIFVRRSRSIPGQSGNEFTNEADKDEFSSATIYVPTADENMSMGDKELHECVKVQIWRGASLAYSVMNQDGKNSQFSAQEGDFRFTSFIWYETNDDPSTSHASTSFFRKSKSRESSLNSPGFPIPFSGDYIRRQFHAASSENETRPSRIFELHCLHFSTVSEKTICKQSERLYKELMINVLGLDTDFQTGFSAETLKLFKHNSAFKISHLADS